MSRSALKSAWAAQVKRLRSLLLCFHMLKYSLLPGLLLASFALSAQTAASAGSSGVEARVVRQNQLFEDYYQNSLKNSPVQATYQGDYRYNDKLDDESLAHVAQVHAEDDGYLAKLKSIPMDGMPDADRLSHDLLVRSLSQRDTAYGLKMYEMPINQQNGTHTQLADLPLSMPFDSVKHYEDYIARLHQISRGCYEVASLMILAVMRMAKAMKWMPLSVFGSRS